MKGIVLNIEGIEELQKQINYLTETLKDVNKPKNDKLTIEFEDDEFVPEYIAAKFLNLKQKELREISKNGLIERNKWNRYLVSNLREYKAYSNE